MVARVLAFLAFVVVASVVFWFAFVHTVHRGTLAVPDLRGETLEQAQRIGHDLGVSVVAEEPGAFSATVPVGSVAEQEPPPGFHIKGGSSVTVRLSLGSERVLVPDVRGESLQGAVRGLEQASLVPGRHDEVNGQAQADQVLATDPPIGSEVAPGTVIDLLVNVTPRHALWVMPSLLSESKEQVRRFCRDHQLRLGQVHDVAYPGLPRNLVLRQYPPAGSPLSRGDIVTIWISR